jgi:hypothetical protein
VITATNFVTQSNDQGEAETQEQVGTVVVTATGEGDEQSTSTAKNNLISELTSSHRYRPRRNSYARFPRNSHPDSKRYNDCREWRTKRSYRRKSSTCITRPADG